MYQIAINYLEWNGKSNQNLLILIIITSFGLEEDDLFDDDIERIMFPPMIFRKSQKIPKEEKIKLLERRKRFVKMRIQKLEGFLQNIENELENLKNKK